MVRLIVLLLVLSAAACDDPPLAPPLASPTSPTQTLPPPAPPPPAVVSVRDVTLGERVEGVIGDGLTINPGEHHFLIPVPADGTLEVVLTWNPWEVGTLLKLTLENREFRPSQPDWSPVVGRLRVEAGKRYRIAVAVAGADWLPKDRFVFTSRLDP